MATIHIQTTIKAPIQKVWELYNSPDAITEWNQASPDWHCPSATVDLQVGVRFKNRMEAIDGSFDFEGEYLEVVQYQKIVYKLDDGRKVIIDFKESTDGTSLFIVFEAENQNPIELQQAGWQSILNNFTFYTEHHGK